MEQNVVFGSLRRRDGFGFVGRGRIIVEVANLTLVGDKGLPSYTRLVVLALVAGGIPALMFNRGVTPGSLGIVALVAVGGILGMLIERYLGKKPAELMLAKDSIAEIRRAGRALTFRAAAPQSRKVRSALLFAESEAAAIALEQAISPAGGSS